MSDFKYILPPNEPKIIKDIGDVGIVPTITENISRSLRFNGSNAYLSRTPASASNRKTWTWSGWVKRGTLGGNNVFMGNTDASGYNGLYFQFDTSDNITIGDYGVGSYVWRLTTSQVFRDPSSWYHIVATFNSTQATASDRVSVYINGTKITAFSTETYPSLNLDGRINSTQLTSIGRLGSYNGFYFDGYLTEINFIDGQALLPTDFGTTDNRTNSWVAKKYRGSYGNNGYNLKFEDNSGVTAATLGKDSSGNGNNWTPYNFSVTAGAGNDSLVDSPTNYGTDTGVGGQVRGNYCAMNPLNKGSAVTLANGNLSLTQTANWNGVTGTTGVSSGKWYFELTYGGGTACVVGVATPTYNITTEPGVASTVWRYRSDDGTKRNGGGSSSAYGATWTTNDVIGVACDMDAGTIVFYKNNSSQGTAFSNLAGNTVVPVVGVFSSSGTTSLNFGQRPFAYTAPTGFKALCTTNLPIPRIKKPSLYFDAVTYTGTGATQSITGLGFSPDLLWTKGRNLAQSHNLFDTLRIGKRLRSDTTGAEALTTVMLDSNGFTLGTETESNNSGSTFVAWAWDAGSSDVTNNSGSITSTVRANPLAGVSVVSYTGTGANATVGHGLGSALKMMIVKNRDSSVAQNWQVYHANLTSAVFRLRLNTTDAQDSVAGIWNSTAPTSSVFSVGTQEGVNENGKKLIAYLFAEVEGFSKFGSYTGNGSADGPFVYCGFRPRWVMIKSVMTNTNWIIFDTARSTYNQINDHLGPNTPGAENFQANESIDATSNGFKIRNINNDINYNTYTHIFAAFAESPFRYANAR